jgi:ribosomal protein S18 acetylase RimI-like enzyme
MADRRPAPTDAWAHPVDLPAIDGLSLRHFRPATDLPAMNGVANRSRQADGDFFVTSDEEFAAYYGALPHCDPARDVVIVTVDEAIVAYGRVTSERMRADDRAWMHGVICLVDAAWRRRGIGTALQATLEARAREIAADEGDGSPVRFRVEAGDSAVGFEPLVRRFGYAPVRYWYTMLRPTLDDVPDRPLPPGLEVRDVRPEHLEVIWAAEVEAVEDHWGNSEVSDEDYQEFLRGATPEATGLWRIAWDGDQVAGQVRSYIDAGLNERDGTKRGWVENITVRQPWRRRGLASALIAASFAGLKARGMTEAMLGVDTENESGALGLYRSMGFETIARSTTWEKPLD